jgi:hypothetical protein
MVGYVVADRSILDAHFIGGVEILQDDAAHRADRGTAILRQRAQVSFIGRGFAWRFGDRIG